MLNLGREQPRVEQRLDSQLALRAKLVAEQAFGDVHSASATLRQLAEVLDGIGGAIDDAGTSDQTAPTDSEPQASAPTRSARRRSRRTEE